MNEGSSFEDAIKIMNLNDLYKIRDILLNKKATPDNIGKLEQIDELITEKKYENRLLEKRSKIGGLDG